jgi:RimJ/RimL family protein N-acetyltransferase
MTGAIVTLNEKELVGKWLADQVNQTAPWGSFYAMGVKVGDEVTSGIVFNSFNACNATAHIAAAKVNRDFSRLLDYGAHYAFNLCRLKRLTGFVEEDNVKALKLDKHIGFVEEGTMKKAGAKGQDVIILVLWPENFRRRKHNG